MQWPLHGGPLFCPLMLRSQLFAGLRELRQLLPNLASTLQVRTRIPSSNSRSKWSLIHAFPNLDATWRPGARPVRGVRAGRDGGALRDFHGGYSADHGPAGPWPRRLSVTRLYDH